MLYQPNLSARHHLCAGAGRDDGDSSPLPLRTKIWGKTTPSPRFGAKISLKISKVFSLVIFFTNPYISIVLVKIICCKTFFEQLRSSTAKISVKLDSISIGNLGAKSNAKLKDFRMCYFRICLEYVNTIIDWSSKQCWDASRKVP